MNHNSGVHLAFFKRNIIPGANTITDIVSLFNTGHKQDFVCF